MNRQTWDVYCISPHVYYVMRVVFAERQPVMRGVVDAWPAKPQTRNSWSGFESNSRDHSAHELLNGLTRLQNSETRRRPTARLAKLANICKIGEKGWTQIFSLANSLWN